MGRSKRVRRGETSTSSSSSSKFFPPELVTEILSWLPGKALIRFSAVCKPWYSLIRSPSFFIKSSNPGSLLLLPTGFGERLIDRTEKFCSIVGGDDDDKTTLVEHEKFIFPSKSIPHWFGNWSVSCNGLICLTNSAMRTLYLYNPSIRKVRSVCSSSIGGGRDLVTVGCGCDKFSGDYKVVRVLKHPSVTAALPEAEVYNITTGSWRRIDDVPDFDACLLSATCNGAVHWWQTPYNNAEAIISFDLSEEVFREMELPDEARSNYGFVMLFNGSLSLFVNRTYSPYGQERVEFEIWVMREYGVAESWAKELTGVVEGIRNWAFGCTKCGKLIFQKTDGMLALLDPKTLQLQDLGFHGNFHKVFDYVETLALLDD